MMKKNVSILLVLLLTVFTLTPAYAETESEIVLAENGSTQYRIVISANAAEKYRNGDTYD